MRRFARPHRRCRSRGGRARPGCATLHPEVIETLGRLRLRVSYGQNVLAHLVECAQLAAVMAAEIGADVEVARRAAFLHDIGKALSAERPGTHAAFGRRAAASGGGARGRCERDRVPPRRGADVASVEGVLVQAADACSASRPGARREELDVFVERMTSLESLVGRTGRGAEGGRDGCRSRGPGRGGAG